MANLDVAVPRRGNLVQYTNVALSVRVDREALPLRKNRPRLRQIASHNPADDEPPECPLQPSLALGSPLSDESFDAGHDGHDAAGVFEVE